MATSIPNPDPTLPVPGLVFDFHMSVALNPRIALGVVPTGGHRNWISFSGGAWEAKFASGTVEPGGQDTQVVNPESLVVRMETVYLLKTDDAEPAFIEVRTRGFRTGPKEVLSRLQDPEQADKISPDEYKFRIFITMETGDPRYAEQVNNGMWVGSGIRKGAEVVYDAYRVT